MRLFALGEELGAASSRTLAPREAAGGTDTIAEILLQDLPLPRGREKVVQEFERRYVERVLAAHDGNVGRAAAASGIALRYFQLLRARHR